MGVGEFGYVPEEAGRIGLSDVREIDYWTAELDIDEDMLREAIVAVGDSRTP